MANCFRLAHTSKGRAALLKIKNVRLRFQTDVLFDVFDAALGEVRNEVQIVNVFLDQTAVILTSD